MHSPDAANIWKLAVRVGETRDWKRTGYLRYNRDQGASQTIRDHVGSGREGRGEGYGRVGRARVKRKEK